MAVDVDAAGGPSPEWYRSELDACRAEIARLRAENVDLMAPLTGKHIRFFDFIERTVS